MRIQRIGLIAALLIVAASSKSLSAQQPAKPLPPRKSDLIAPTAAPPSGAAQIHWGPAPAVFPAGAELAVMQGDPSKSEPYTVRLRMPNGYRLPAHTHPTTENVTVISGTFLAGMGRQFDTASLRTFAPGDFASLPAGEAHYAMARGTTVVQVHGIGPFAINYVNPSDNPTTKAR